MANTQKKTSARCLKAEVHLIGSMACAEGEAVRRSAILAEDWTKISSAYSINKNERLNHLAEGASPLHGNRYIVGNSYVTCDLEKKKARGEGEVEGKKLIFP